MIDNKRITMNADAETLEYLDELAYKNRLNRSSTLRVLLSLLKQSDFDKNTQLGSFLTKGVRDVR